MDDRVRHQGRQTELARTRFEQILPSLASSPLTPLLIFGEGGLAVARRLHRMTYRKRNAPLVVVDCVWLPESRAGSLLFGHRGKPGARGHLELAGGGTLVLDNIEYLPGPEQSALGDFLDRMAFRPIGSSRLVHVALRVVAVTQRTPDELVRVGGLRSALKRRLDVIVVQLGAHGSEQADLEANPGPGAALGRHPHESVSAQIPSRPWGGAMRPEAPATDPRGAMRLSEKAMSCSKRSRVGWASSMEHRGPRAAGSPTGSGNSARRNAAGPKWPQQKP